MKIQKIKSSISQNTFNLILIKEKKNSLKKHFFWTTLLKINFWDNIIYKTIFGQFLLNKEIFRQFY